MSGLGQQKVSGSQALLCVIAHPTSSGHNPTYGHTCLGISPPSGAPSSRRSCALWLWWVRPPQETPLLGILLLEHYLALIVMGSEDSWGGEGQLQVPLSASGRTKVGQSAAVCVYPELLRVWSGLS